MMSDFKHRSAVIALSVFLAVSPILPYVIGTLSNTFLLRDLQKQVAAIPPYPYAAFIEGSFTVDRSFDDYEREWAWQFEYKTDAERDLVDYYRKMLPAHSMFRVYGSSSQEGGVTSVTVTIHHRFNIRFDFLRYTP